MAEKSVLQKIVNGVAAVAPTVANLVLPGSGPILHSLMRAVSGSADGLPIEQVAEAIQADPALLVELHRLAMDTEVKLAEIDAKKMETVNATMQGESKSEHWPQYSWRPFNGFAYAVAVILIYFVLPLTGKAIPVVPEWIWIGWGTILGVTTWDRGKVKRVAAGEQKPGLIASVIGAIKN